MSHRPTNAVIRAFRASEVGGVPYHEPVKRLVLPLLLLLFACNSGGDAAAPPDTTGTAAASVPKGLDWTADLIGGGTLEGATLAGGDVALWFWAPW
jgi:hypothetical protein